MNIALVKNKVGGSICIILRSDASTQNNTRLKGVLTFVPHLYLCMKVFVGLQLIGRFWTLLEQSLPLMICSVFFSVCAEFIKAFSKNMSYGWYMTIGINGLFTNVHITHAICTKEPPYHHRC